MIDKYVNAEELKRLLSTLIVILTALAIPGLFALIVVPGLRNANEPRAQTPVIPVLGEPGWLDPAEFPPERGREIPPVDPKALIASSPELIAKGKDLFEKNCISCHGSAGHGDGPAAGTMDPRPRNFTSPDGWTNGFDLPAIYRTISTGVQNTSMSPFDYLSKQNRMALAHYVQSFGAFAHGTGSTGAMEALSKELAAPGGKTPNKIPVSMAMAKLEQEFTAAPLIEVSSDDHSAGAEVLRKAVTDPARAAQTLADTSSWRKGPKELAGSILPDIPGNGFSVNCATLNVGEWELLQEELLKIAVK
jgi:mono/diheme cytochrome c family protein